MNGEKLRNREDIVPRSFFTKISVFLTVFFVVIAGAGQIYLFFQTRTFLEFHYSAVLLKLAGIKDEIFFKSMVVSLVFFIITLLLVLAFLNISCFLVRKKNNGVAICMVNDLNMVASGDFSQRIRLRKKDLFQDVADSLNGFLEKKATRYRSMRGAMAEIQADLGNIRLAEARGALPVQELERLRDKAAMLNGGLVRGETAAPACDSRAWRSS